MLCISKCSFILLLFTALLISSCEDRPLYEEVRDIEGAWAFSDSLSFTLPVPDTSAAYDLVVDVSHSKSYPFQNLYLKIATTYPSGAYASDILNIDLADKAGNWKGSCSGDLCNFSSPFKRFFSFKENGNYSIRVIQYTRKEMLEGVHSIELELWPSRLDN